MSVTAALYESGWRGLLVEADPDLARELRAARLGDTVAEVIAASSHGVVTFYRVPGTGLGTTDVAEAAAAAERGFAIAEVQIETAPLDHVLDHFVGQSGRTRIDVMSIDVEGAEGEVLRGLSLDRHRPVVLCIESVSPGTDTPSHEVWDPYVRSREYRFVSFDGVNRWYVDEHHADSDVGSDAGAPQGTTIAEAIATPFHVIDVGAYGWRAEEVERLADARHRAERRNAWFRELTRGERATAVPREEYLRQIDELRTALVGIQGSRTYRGSRVIAHAGGRILHVLHRIMSSLPAPLARRLTRERHLRHVAINMEHLTDPAYLGRAPADVITWGADALRPPMPPGLDTGALDDVAPLRRWLDENPCDDDASLDARMDNLDDEVGRVQRALRTRIRLHGSDNTPADTPGRRIVFDARSLQSTEFGLRGIGRFARTALLAARAEVGDERISLIIDPGLPPLPEDLAGACTQIRRVTPAEAPMFGSLIQPSPMTHPPDPIISLLTTGVRSLAIVYDFIPLHYPTIYLAHAAPRAEYAANLDALRRYRDFVCISETTRSELARALGLSETEPRIERSRVAWPRGITENSVAAVHRDQREGPIVIMTGDEPRKNTFGGLAGVAAATSDQRSRDVVVIGMAGQGDRVHHWSIAAAMRPGEARTLGRIDDDELREVLTRAACVVVPSFDEGLSLPVIEAVQVGTPVVASEIASHRELLGRSRLFDPSSPRSISRAVRRALRGGGDTSRQRRALSAHPHVDLEEVITEFTRPSSGASHVTSVIRPRSERLSIGVMTPWTPQRSGVADFSTTVFEELSKLADVTVYTTSGAEFTIPGMTHRSITHVFDDPAAVSAEHDLLISVVGNSHFHLPMVKALEHVNALVVAHDTRMVEFYLALRGEGGAAAVLQRTCDPGAPGGIQPPLAEQIADMRLLQNAGMWEVARRSTGLVLHSPISKDRIARETGVSPVVLPFANQRVPAVPPSRDERRAARRRVGMGDVPPDTVVLGTFGYVDTRTKLTDVVLEAAGWLTSWGRSIVLTIVGAASDQQRRELSERAHHLGLAGFSVTGFQTEDQFQDWLLAIDLGVQLRISPLLGVSGPLSDLAAFGTPAVASAGLCVDVDTPAYIYALPDDVSPVIVAEGVESALAHEVDPEERERARREYLDRMSSAHYAEQLLIECERLLA